MLQFVFFFPVQRCKPLFLCISLPLTFLPLLLFLDVDGAVGGDWKEQWRRWWFFSTVAGSVCCYFSACAEVPAPSSSRVLQQGRKMVGGCRRLLTSGVAVGGAGEE
jgi:hypothetical protein